MNEPLVTIEDYKEYYRYTKPEIHLLRQRVEELEMMLEDAWFFVPANNSTCKRIAALLENRAK